MAALRTDRLELRPPTASDLDQVAALGEDLRVMASLGGRRSRTQCQAWLDRELEHHRKHGYGRYVVTREAQFVGLVGLSRSDFERGIVPGVEVAWQLAFDHWHQGYATEAARVAIEQASPISICRR